MYGFRFQQYLMLLFVFIKFNNVITYVEEIVTDEMISTWRNNLKKCPNRAIEARLHHSTALPNGIEELTRIEISNNTGLLEIIFPYTTNSLFLCYLDDSENNQQMYLLAHSICRKMGFMTVSNIKGKDLPNSPNESLHYGIKGNSYECSGLSRCIMTNINVAFCQLFAEISCGTCDTTVKSLNGSIKVLGYPSVSLPDVTCEWSIIVPVKYSISLSFDSSELQDEQFTTLPCSLQKPYIEIMYGLQSKVTVHRYCQSNDVKNLTIPFHSVKIRVFTGMQPHEGITTNKTIGTTVTFLAIQRQEEYESPMKMLLLSLIGLVFISCTIICRYIRKYKCCDIYLSTTPPSVKIQGTEKLPLYRSERSNYTWDNNFDQKFEANIEHGKDIQNATSISETFERFDSNAAQSDEDRITDYWHPKVRLTAQLPEKSDPNRLSVSMAEICPAVGSYYHRNISESFEFETDLSVLENDEAKNV